MARSRRIPLALVCCTLLWTAGCCVGPLACGPGGAFGPIGLNTCDGCGECGGCGELYIDPWINEPADCCDPCDRCGNYNGQSCGKCRSVFSGFASLWGYRCDPPCDGCGVAGCGGGCDAIPVDAGCGLEPACGCEPGCGCESCGGVPVVGERVISMAQPPMLTRPMAKAKPVPHPYQPRRTRQIFTPRGEIADGQVISITR